MAFTLTRVAPNTFTAPVTVPFTITVTVDQGIIVVQSVTYDGVTLNAPPFTFTVGAGSKNLAMVFAATDPQATITISEVDGANLQKLTERPGTDTDTTLIIN